MTDLLAEAQRMLDEPSPATASAWPRAAALLARLQLEASLQQIWGTKAPTLKHVSMRAQLACLPSYLGDDKLARDSAYAWSALSRATHHHPYELDPTRDELASLIQTVRRLDAATHASTPPAHLQP